MACSIESNNHLLDRNRCFTGLFGMGAYAHHAHHEPRQTNLVCIFASRVDYTMRGFVWRVCPHLVRVECGTAYHSLDFRRGYTGTAAGQFMVPSDYRAQVGHDIGLVTPQVVPNENKA